MQQMILGFRIWYADGSVVVGETLADWNLAPTEGAVQVFKYGESDAGPFKVRYKGDWIWWQDDDLHRVPISDWGAGWAPRPDVPCENCVKKGGVVSDQRYDEIEAEGRASSWP